MKTCSRCGIEKDESEFQAIKSNRVKKGYYYKGACKECDNASRRIYAKTNPEIRRGWERRSREKNRDKKVAKDNRYRAIHRDKIINYHRVKLKRDVDALTDRYVRSLLRNQGFPSGAISNEIIEIKRLIIKTQREVSNNENKD